MPTCLKFIRLPIIAAALLGLTGCGMSAALNPFDGGAAHMQPMPAPASGVANAIAPAMQMAAAAREIYVQPGDELEFGLIATGAILGVAQVDGQGRAFLPLVGVRKIAGKSFSQVGKYIEDKHLGPVKVRLKSAPAIIIVGEVGTPGGIAFEEGLTLAELLKRAGGATHKADLRLVFIKPRGSASEIAVAFDEALPILPGDTVRLKQRYF